MFLEGGGAMKKLISSLAILGMASSVYALEFQPIGTRQLGMGGVGVASTADATAQYYNPAIFGFFAKEGKRTLERKKFGFNAQGGLGLRLNNDFGKSLDNLSKVNYDSLSRIADAGSNLNRSDYENAVKLLSYLSEISDREGAITINGDAVVATRIKRFGVGAYGLVETSGKPTLDLENIGFTTTTANTPAQRRQDAINAIVSGTTDNISNSSISQTAQNYFGGNIANLQQILQNAGFTPDQAIDIINQAAEHAIAAGIPSDYVNSAIELVADSVNASADGKTIDKNESTVDTSGIGLAEVPITYGHPLTNSFAVGLNVKFVRGMVYEQRIKIFNNDSKDVVEKIKDSYKESNNFAVDLGALYMPTNWLKIGVVGKYLNSPKFDRPSGGKYTVKPQARVGIALNPFETLTIAADADITKNDTALPGYKSQNVGVGVEWDVLKFLALRGGAYRNIAQSDIGNIYTLGLGINLYLIRADIAAAFSGKKSKFNDKDFPSETRVQANLSIEF